MYHDSFGALTDRQHGCSQQRNLADNNGWLDEVLWVVNTENEDDLRYLDEILASSPRHRKLDLGRMVRGPEFRQIWKHLERGKIYVKIDDDVVSREKVLFIPSSS